MKNSPIIGIIGKHGKENVLKPVSIIRDEIKQAVFDNGGIAIGIISPNSNIIYCDNEWEKFENSVEYEKLIQAVELCDGIILQGGSTNEVFENYTAKYCYENDIPILGICAGQNSMVRALGGTIIKINHPEKHERPFDEYVHYITIDKKSKFYKIIQKEKILVNSRHIKAVDICKRLNKVGFCEDNYAEVVESPHKLFYIGVRFHPESLYKIDENMRKIFVKFINACK